MVCGVGISVCVLQPLSERRSRPGEPGPDGADGEVEKFGRIFVGVPEHANNKEDLRVMRSERAKDVRDVVGIVDCGHPTGALKDSVVHADRALRRSDRVINDDVSTNSEEPTFERSAPVEGIDVLPCANKGVLNRLLGGPPVSG